MTMLKPILSILLLSLFICCRTETQTNIIVTSQNLPNNKLIEITKTEKTNHRKGFFTKHDYGHSYSFNYQFTINNGEIIWKDKVSAVPKAILFCKDTVYVKYLQKKNIAYQKLNYNVPKTEYKDTIFEKYDKFIDNRYFFKWFGDFHWVEISQKDYNTKNSICEEYAIIEEEVLKINPKKTYRDYEITKDSVVYHYTFYDGTRLYKAVPRSFKIEKADSKTFVELTDQYAKDQFHIYYKGSPIKRDLKTFRVINDLFSIDKFGVYCNNKIIKGSHGLSFKLLGDRYAIDNNQMYFVFLNGCTRIKNIDRKTFKIIACQSCNSRFCSDKNNIYFQGKLIKKADIQSFKIIKYSFSKDNKHIFYRDKIIENVDYGTFHILEKNKYKGKTTIIAEDNINEYGYDHNSQLVIFLKEKNVNLAK